MTSTVELEDLEPSMVPRFPPISQDTNTNQVKRPSFSPSQTINATRFRGKQLIPSYTVSIAQASGEINWLLILEVIALKQGMKLDHLGRDILAFLNVSGVIIFSHSVPMMDLLSSGIAYRLRMMP